MERLWHGFRLVASENSIYGNLAVIAGEASGTIYESGVAVATVPDPAAAEEAVHYALLEHPQPHSLLLIGGGALAGLLVLGLMAFLVGRKRRNSDATRVSTPGKSSTYATNVCSIKAPGF